jgi:peroxisomal membrane protein 2
MKIDFIAPLSLYSANLTLRPILTKASTSATLYTLQEIIAALVTGSPADSAKALRMALYGFFISGPLGHFLYSRMENLFAGVKGGKGNLLRLLFSNLIITPVQNSSYLFALALIAGARPKKAFQIIRSKLLSLMKISWIISPVAQMFAFQYLEPKFYVPFFNLVGFLFGTTINIQAKLEAKKKRE